MPSRITDSAEGEYGIGGKGFVSTCFADRLEHYAPLSAQERRALARLEEHPRHIARGAMIRRQLDNARELLILVAGWAFSQIMLADGTRQIVRIELPGDLLGLGGLAFPESPESIVAVTDVTVAGFDRLALRDLYVEHPRLAAMIQILCAADRTALSDRLASIGRTPAKARVAALIVDLLVRLRLSRADIRDRLPLLVTQEEIGDATGLTAVHVNRMLRQLAEERLIERTPGHVRVLDEQRLREVACYTSRFSALDMSWLPDGG